MQCVAKAPTLSRVQIEQPPLETEGPVTTSALDHIAKVVSEEALTSAPVPPTIGCIGHSDGYRNRSSTLLVKGFTRYLLLEGSNLGRPPVAPTTGLCHGLFAQ